MGQRKLQSNVDDAFERADINADPQTDGLSRASRIKNHRTVDRITQIVEEVVYKPGLTFVELANTIGAPKSSVYGFLRGLLARGWLIEEQRRFYLGPAVYGLTLASGYMRAGIVRHDDLTRLYEDTGFAVSLAVRASDQVISIAEAGRDAIADFQAHKNLRRTLIATAAGKALLAALPQSEQQAYLRSRSESEQDMVVGFVADYPDIRRTGLATNYRLGGSRFAIASCVRDASGQAVAAVTIVGRTEELQPRATAVGALLLERIAEWSRAPINLRDAI